MEEKPSSRSADARIAQAQESADDGLALRRTLYGEEDVENIMDRSDDFMMMFQNFTNDVCFGNLWQRPGLSHKIRSLLSLTILASKAQGGGVKRHVRTALRQGWTKEEIGEVFLHVYVYSGVYASLSSFIAAKEEFDLMLWEEEALQAKEKGEAAPNKGDEWTYR